METINYELKSMSRTVIVPASSAKVAESWVKYIEDEGPNGVGKIVMNYPIHYIRSSGKILAATFFLPREQDYLRLLDEIYLKLCLNEIQLLQLKSEGKETEKISQIISKLEEIIKEFEE